MFVSHAFIVVSRSAWSAYENTRSVKIQNRHNGILLLAFINSTNQTCMFRNHQSFQSLTQNL